MSVVVGVVLPSLVNAVIGFFGLLVAERERRRGSAWWDWVVPGVFGALLIVVVVLRSLWVL
jgi:integral membrane sensor domain MASE1